LQPLVNALRHITHENTSHVLHEKFNFIELIGQERLRRYYRYDGSLTTPPCYESVVWSVVDEPIRISVEQLQAFKYLYDSNGKVIENTYRPVQALGTRKLFRTFQQQYARDEIQTKASRAEQTLPIHMSIMLVIVSIVTGIHKQIEL
jgi:carbonic anhydrase